MNNSKQKEKSKSSNFRPIQYLGSKLMLLDDLEEVLINLKISGRVCDLFSGSGVVSRRLRDNYTVTSVDIQRYAFVLASALLKPSSWRGQNVEDFLESSFKSSIGNQIRRAFAPLIKYEDECLALARSGDDINPLIKFVNNASLYLYINGQTEKDMPKKLRIAFEKVVSNIEKLSSRAKRFIVCSSYYGGVYFSYSQSACFDSMMYTVKAKHKNDSLPLAMLLSSASKIVNTVGKQFAQPIKLIDKNGKPKSLLIKRTIRDRSYDVCDVFKDFGKIYLENILKDGNSHQVFQKDYFEFLKEEKREINCFYADPPYTIDHYSRFYHVLETLALYDNPYIEKMTKEGKPAIMRGLYRANRHQSPFCIPSKVKEAFECLFAGTRRHNAPLILSYSPSGEENNRQRLVQLSDIKRLARKYYNGIEIEYKKHQHRKLNSSANNVKSLKRGEVFIICKP